MMKSEYFPHNVKRAFDLLTNIFNWKKCCVCVENFDELMMMLKSSKRFKIVRIKMKIKKLRNLPRDKERFYIILCKVRNSLFICLKKIETVFLK
jgi:hypothetical protein